MKISKTTPLCHRLRPCQTVEVESIALFISALWSTSLVAALLKYRDELASPGRPSQIWREVSGARSLLLLQNLLTLTKLKLTLTKLRVYNISIIVGLLYAGETWTTSAADYGHLDAFDSQSLWKILDIRWQDFVTNAEVRRRTQQPLASTTSKARRLSLFGHTSRLDPSVDLRMARAGALAPPREWKRSRGRPRNTWLSTVKDDLATLNLGLFSAVQKARDRQGWRNHV